MEKRQTTLDYSIVTQVILLRPKAETTDQALATFFKAVHHAQPHISLPGQRFDTSIAHQENGWQNDRVN